MAQTDIYFELKIKINPQMPEILSEIISGICFDKLNCEGIVQAEEEYKDDLVLVSTTEDTLKVYLKSIDKVPEILKEERNLLLENGFSESDLGSWDYEISKVENEDWSQKWKENWDVTTVSEKIKVVPSWIEYEQKPDEIIITLDPGTAFGTGTHATTQLCMRAMETLMTEGAKVADIGTGSGILAICAIKLGAKSAYGCDNDEAVIETAIRNARMNDVLDKCVFEHNTADKITEKFDFITANILHNILAEIMGDLKALMNDDATLVLSGILDEKKYAVINAIKKHGLKLIEETHQDIWTGLIVRK